MAQSQNLERFQTILLGLVDYIEQNIPQCSKEAQVARFKVEAGLDLNAPEVARRFSDTLSEYAELIADRDEEFIRGPAKTIPFLDKLDLEAIWSSIDATVKDELWKRFNKALTFASLAAGAGGGGGAPNLPGDINSEEFMGQVQNMMPMVMQMMGPMLGQMKAGAGGKKSISGRAQLGQSSSGGRKVSSKNTATRSNMSNLF